MFERFTAYARRAVVMAQEEAREMNHNYIGTEHILLALLRRPDDLPNQVDGGASGILGAPERAHTVHAPGQEGA
jgi:ATP-dependent Clp protease ATP-binding subunit ClpC